MSPQARDPGTPLRVRDSERGFTLIEVAVTIAIVAIVACASVWMLGMRPGALRHAVDEYDSALSVAHALAATSGNGATMVFAPHGNAGFTIRVYRGRPTSANAVTPTNTFVATSDTAISERTLGSPPFAIFFDSAGYATGKASYPQLDALGNATFATIAAQPPCPGSGILLTFTSPQGVTDTRQLPCAGVALSGTGAPNPTPTPNAPRISPTAMVAHWTNDRNGALKFRVAEYGYAHWFAKGDAACDAISTYAAPNTPYNPPTDPNEASLPPAPPASTPYSYPDTTSNPDEPIAPFELWPLSAQPGTCTLTVVDDYGQQVHASVQVMGDLTPDQPSLTFDSPAAPPQTVTLTKTWDSEPLQLNIGGNCLTVVTWSARTTSTPSSPGAVPASAQITVSPQSVHACTMLVGDQYGEPLVSIPIDVKAAALATWPESVVMGVGGAAMPNGCYGAAKNTGGGADPLASLPGWVVSQVGQYIMTDGNGCYTDSNGTPVSPNSPACAVIGGSCTTPPKRVSSTQNCHDGATEIDQTTSYSFLGSGGGPPPGTIVTNPDGSQTITRTATGYIYEWERITTVTRQPTTCRTSSKMQNILAATISSLATTDPVGGVVYEPDQSTKTFIVQANWDTCNGTSATETGWLPTIPQGVSAAVRTVKPGSSAGSCTMALTDGTTSTLAIDHGLIDISVLP